MTSTETELLTGERADLLETLGKHRGFLTYTVRDLSDEQARLRPPASQLTPGGLIKHVPAAERNGPAFIADAPAPSPAFEESTYGDGAAESQIPPGEPLRGLRGAPAGGARRTDE